jgi:KDO2-lipid IV(A) lauroyltransferase
MRSLIRFLSRRSLPSLYRLGDAVSFVAFRVLRWRRRVAADNLEQAFPDKSRAEVAATLRQSYRNLGDLIAELFWSYGATPEDLRQRVTVENPDEVRSRTRAGRPVLLLTAHFCNWEWQVLAANAILEAPIYPVYKPLRVQAIDAFLREARGRFGGAPIPHKQFTRELLRRRSEPNVYAMVADQTPTAAEPKHWTRFLGRDTAFFVGADAIARILKADVLFVQMRRVCRGHYAMRVVPIAGPPYVRGADTGIIERYARALEEEVRASPADWLWVHRKWKYERPGALPEGDAAGVPAGPGPG